jgi:alkylation response protein AidB-like acyl-CoA dehydrogenase
VTSEPATLKWSEDEVDLARAVRAYADSNLPLSDIRLAREVPAGSRLHEKIWNELLGLGWLTLNLSVRQGGADAGLATLGVVAEELGRCLSDLPLVSAAVSASLLAESSTPEASQALAELVTGDLFIVLAAQEGRVSHPLVIDTSAKRVDASFVINGVTVNVADADVADAFVVAAKTTEDPSDGGGVSLFLVPADTSGIRRLDVMGVDSRWTSRIDFTDVRVDRSCLVSDVGKGTGPLQRAVQIGTLLTAAEMVGSASAAFELTLTHLKEREQFGVPIGSFQALQHRMARAWVTLELAKSAVREALRIFDDDPGEVDAAASAAKSLINDASRLVMAEGLQMHGGLGMTDEANIGLFLKRSRVAEHSFGGSDFHRDRFASVLGF